MSEHTLKRLFTFFPSPLVFCYPQHLLFKIAQRNLYKREKTAWIFLFQMPGYTFIKKRNQREKKYKEQQDKGSSV